MNLTDKELELMAVLWSHGKAMTTSEIYDASPNRTWADMTIYTMLKTLIKKKAVAIHDYKPTATVHARTYKAIISPEEYAMKKVSKMMKTGVRVHIPTLVEGLMAMNEKDW